MRLSAEQRVIVIYDRITHALSGISLAEKDELERLHDLLTKEAASHDSEDSVALRLMRQIVEVYRDTD